jgi:signal transduction histidine kinase
VNLLLNAVEAMGSRGTLTIRSSLQPNGAAIENGPSGPQLCLTIQDTGIGIPEEILPRLFEPFVTSKPTGTGLGLAITRRIIHQHQGTIAVRSLAGQGTIFTLSLPALQAAP